MTLTLTKNEKRWGLMYLALYLLVVPFLSVLVCMLAGTNSETVINLVCFFANAALAIGFFHRLLNRSLYNAEQSWLKTVVIALKGFGLYWVMNMAVSMVIVFIDPEFANVNDANLGGMVLEHPTLMHLALIVAAPLAEECLFRGWMFTGLAEKSVPLAYIVTCGFFSAAHVVGYIGMYDAKTLVLCFLQYIAPSFVLCRTCQKNDGLMAPLLLHMTINAISCALMSLMGG